MFPGLEELKEDVPEQEEPNECAIWELRLEQEEMQFPEFPD